MHEADQPDLVVDFAYANDLASEHGAQVDLASSEADTAAAGYSDGSVVI